MTTAFRVYVAGVIGTGLTFLCHLFNHYPLPCRWTNNRLFLWADDVTGFREHPELCGAMNLPCTGEPIRCNQQKGHAGAHCYSIPGYSLVWFPQFDRRA